MTLSRSDKDCIVDAVLSLLTMSDDSDRRFPKNVHAVDVKMVEGYFIFFISFFVFGVWKVFRVSGEAASVFYFLK